MNSNQQDIVAFIEDMHAARHLIAEAYCNGSIDILDENQKLLRKLQQIRAMRPNVNRDNSLRLSSPMMNLLDQAVHRVRSLAISSNFSDQISRLMTLAEGYMRATIETRQEDQDMYASDFDLAAYDISEEVSAMLLQVSTLAHTNFAHASSYGEKVRQNDHYLTQMKKLVSTLTQLQDPALLEMLESSFDLQPLSQLYARHILNSMSSWRSLLMDIIAHLERYLNKLRQVEPNAKRIRVFSMFLHQHPEYSPREVDEYPEIPEWAYRHEGINITTYPDITDESTQDDLMDVAQSIERAKQTLTVVREEGVLIEDDEPEVIELNPTPFDQMVYAYVQQAAQSTVGLSARDFFEASGYLPDTDLDVSLICFASLLDNPKKLKEVGADEVLIERIELPITNTYCGNITILDFTACQRP
jgi:hypothetical protein